jgi:predicted unusual protein kinase regulating ubiquinone biosynthesis (AarF/ABC1/UbiB family)
MKDEEKIPTSRLARTGSFIGTGARIGRNYLSYYGKRALGNDDQDALQEKNADDIYRTLSKLRGSALKVAQMMSLDEGILPKAYSDKFALSQYSVPPLSYPLVVQTVRRSLGAGPSDLFDSFSKNAVAAASIGQVHQAEYKGEKLAVKVQYPGVADSISSDLRIVKPIVNSILNISSSELEHYLQEVEERLLEETDYHLEFERSKEITEASSHIKGLHFPKYFEELSGDRVLSMEWLEGNHLDKFLAGNPSQEVRNRAGQLLWDFYDFQIHELKQVHADPHPGNFLIRENGELGVIDFGCVKELSEEFYRSYFRLMDEQIVGNIQDFRAVLFELGFLLDSDGQEQLDYFLGLYREVHQLVCRPFFATEFDFSDKSFFDQIYALSTRLSGDKNLRKSKAARGPRDAIYLNRTYFGLYSFLQKLGAKIKTHSRLGEETVVRY